MALWSLFLSGLLGCGPTVKTDETKLAGISAYYGPPHSLSIAQQHITWTIKKNFGDKFLDTVSNEWVEQNVQMAISTWASVSNLRFRRVSGPADVTFEWVENDASLPYAVGYCDRQFDANGDIIGARIVFNKGSKKASSNPGHWEAGDIVQNWWHDRDTILANSIHEFGHFLGLGDYPSLDPAYKPEPATNISVMAYDWGPNAPLMSAYDVRVIQQKYGAPKHVPMIELRRGNGKYMYTKSWEEANQLITSHADIKVTNLIGALARERDYATIPLIRYYHAGLDGQEISMEPISDPAYTYEGELGWMYMDRQPNMVPLRLIQEAATGEQRFSTLRTNPPGHFTVGASAWGYVTPVEAIGIF